MADAAAAVALLPLTASGYEPGGAPALVALAASGYEPGGAPTLEVLTATGQGYSADAQGASTLEALTGSGTQLGNNDATGAVEFEPLAGIGYTPVSGQGTFEALTAAGQSDSGQVGAGAPLLAALTASGVALSVGDASGAAILQQLAASGVAQNGGDATGAASLLRLAGRGQSDSGTVGSGAPALVALVASGTGYTAGTASGAVLLPRLLAYGVGESAVSAATDSFAMNTRTNAVTRYPSLPVNSLARYNGTYIGAGPDGLVSMEGPDELDTSWTVRTGQLDGKNAMLKRLTEVLMGVRYSGPVRVRIWTNDSTYYDYAMPNLTLNEIQQVRAKVGKGLRSRYFKVELSGESGRFELDSLQATMVPTTRRIG